MSNTIVFIAPNSHIALLAQSAVALLKLDIPVIEAYDYKAIEELRKYPSCRIVISRGGTSNFLKGVKGLTVVDLTASYFDIQKSVNELVKKGCNNIAVISQDNVIGLTSAEFAIKDVNVSLHPCTNTEEIINTVNTCVRNGADGIVGCAVAVETAKEHDIRVAPVETDFFTIKKGILNALELEANLEDHDRMIERIESVLDNIEEGIIIFDAENTPIVYNDCATRLMRPEPLNKWYQKLFVHLKNTTDSTNLVTLNQNRILIRVINLKKSNESEKVVILTDSSAIEETAKTIKISAYEKGLVARRTFKDIKYASQIMSETVALAKRFSDSDSTVMLFGETGVGKEGFAQSIHNSSPRANKPFVSVNCASLPQGLVASELFGYAEGAFTGARRNGKKGLFELAQGGTIFLDEITEIPLEVQSQFLRVIQEREVMRVGDDHIIPLDIRIICASNKQILPLCEEGKFRFDLYYRLNVLSLAIPALRERGDDVIVLFANFFCEFLHQKVEDLHLEENIKNLLKDYSWPGNVRELRNVAEALSFYGNSFTLQDLKKLIQRDFIHKEPSNTQIPLLHEDLTLNELEKQYYTYMLKKHSLKEICLLAGISRTSLWRKLKSLNLEDSY